MKRKLRAPKRAFKRRYVRKGKWTVARAPKVHYFKEMTQLTSLGVGAGGMQGFNITYKASDLTNWPNFKNMFDLYKLTGVKLRIIPLGSTSDVNNGYPNTAGQVGSLPMLYVAPNRDPYTPVPATVADILNDDGCRIIRLEKPVKFYLKSPKPQLQTVGEGGGQEIPLQLGTRSSQQFWLTTGGNSQVVDQSAVPHFGHRVYLVNNASAPISVQVYATYYFCLKEQD